MQGKIEIKNGAYTEYVSILISILTPQCARQRDREQALSNSQVWESPFEKRGAGGI